MQQVWHCRKQTGHSNHFFQIFSHLHKHLLIVEAALALSISPHWEFCILKGFSWVTNRIFLCPIPISVSGWFGPEHHPMARVLTLLFNIKNPQKTKIKVFRELIFVYYILKKKKEFPSAVTPNSTWFHNRSQIHPSTWNTSTSTKRMEKEEGGKKWEKFKN